MKYDLLIIGAGPGGIFSAYEAMKLNPELKIGLFESGTSLEKRKCPIDGDKILCKLQILQHHEWIWRCRRFF